MEKVSATQSIDSQGNVSIYCPIYLHSFVQLQRFINNDLSKGNYFRDTDGNTVLDLDCPLALGYNNDALINARDSPMYDRFLQGKVNSSNVAPHDYADILRENVMPVAPTGMAQVHLADGSVTDANETAMNLAIETYAKNHNKTDISSMKVLSFSNASHGNSIATLSVSDPAVNSANSPTFNWPRANLPNMIYPFNPNQEDNLAREN